MANVALVTDSTTNIPKKLLGGTKLEVAPTVVIWSGDELRDGVDIQPVEFYKRLASAKEMPTTSQPTPATFKEIYEKLVSEGKKDILSVHVSSKLSGTVASAEQAKAMVSGANIEIIDGYSASMGTGWPILHGMKAAKAGKSLKEVAAAVRKAGEQTGVILMVDTLEFLHRGGRMGGAQRYLGTALKVKPILEIQDGALEALERVRTKGKATERLVDLLEERIAGRTPVYVAAIHANALEDAEMLLAEAIKRVNPKETVITDVSPSVGTHTGPGTIGYCYMAGLD